MSKCFSFVIVSLFKCLGQVMLISAANAWRFLKAQILGLFAVVHHKYVTVSFRGNDGETGESSPTHIHTPADHSYVQVRRQFFSTSYLVPNVPGKYKSVVKVDAAQRSIVTLICSAIGLLVSMFSEAFLNSRRSEKCQLTDHSNAQTSPLEPKYGRPSSDNWPIFWPRRWYTFAMLYVVKT